MDHSDQICAWAQSNSLMREYHNQEWGVPNYQDNYLFEMLNLEGAQSGLSWLTILKKREGYRKAFHQFDISVCAEMTDEELAEIVKNGEVVRHPLKINSVRSNAIAAQKVIKEYGNFADYVWHFTDFKRQVNKWTATEQLPAKSELSEQISKDMKKRGFKFVGPVTIYSFLQAVGIIDDHVITCPYHSTKK